MPIESPPVADPVEPPLFPGVLPTDETDSTSTNSLNGIKNREDAGNPPTDSDPSDATGNEPAGESAALFEEELPPGDSSADASLPALQSDSAAAAGTTAAIDAHGAHGALPPNWPDERGFIPPPPSHVRKPCCPNSGPIMTHTRIYHATDSEFTEALASYYHFRDDARFGGWQNYLQRSDDFIRFCCHMHIAEMLSARGGAGETRVVWQWSDSR
jgi:hypothetical protein